MAVGIIVKVFGVCLDLLRHGGQRVRMAPLVAVVLWSSLLFAQAQPASQPVTQPTTSAGEEVSVLHFPPEQNEVVIPLTECQYLLFTKDVKINGQSLNGWWLVDTGAAFSAIDSNHARKLKLPILPEYTPLVEETVEPDVCQVDSLSIGPIEITDHVIFSMDLAHLAKGFGVDLVGLIGGDIWWTMPFSVDFQGPSVRFYNPETFRPPAGARSQELLLASEPSDSDVPARLAPFEGRPVVTVTLNKELSCHALLDTGCNYEVVLDRTFVDKDPELADTSRIVALSSLTISGTRILFSAQIHELSVFGHKLSPPKRSAVEMKRSSLGERNMIVIGSPVLQDFRLTFDYANATIWTELAQVPSIPQQLADGMDPNQQDISGRPPILRAATGGDWEAFSALLEAGAGTGHSTPNGFGLLHCAAEGGCLEIIAKSLEEQPEQIHARTKGENTPLMVAARWASAEGIKLLLDAGADLKAKDAIGGTAVHHAVFHRNRSALTALAQAGADLNIQATTGISPLALCATTGYMEMFQLLESLGAKAGRAPKGLTLVHLAALGGNPKLIEYVLNTYEMDVTVKTDQDATPLHAACDAGHVESVSFLVEVGADPLAVAADGHTGLHMAGARGHLEVAELLIASGINLDPATHKDGRTALLQAAVGGHYEVVSALLKAGADPNFADSRGFAPLHMAAFKKRIKTVEVLVEAGVALDGQDNLSGGTPLMAAAEAGSPQIVKILLDAGADPMLVARKGETVLHVGAVGGQPDTFKLLLEMDIDVDLRAGELKETALMIASRLGHEDVVRLLLEAGADPDLRDARRLTAMHYATRMKQKGVLKILQAHILSRNRSTPATRPAD